MNVFFLLGGNMAINYKLCFAQKFIIKNGSESTKEESYVYIFRKMFLRKSQREFWGKIGVKQSGGSRYERDNRKFPTPVKIALSFVYKEELERFNHYLIRNSDIITKS